MIMDLLYVIAGLLCLASPWIFISWIIDKVYD